MEQYNASLPYDRLFYAEDIAGSIAFARANKDNGQCERYYGTVLLLT
jgi:argininosuccinate lyase